MQPDPSLMNQQISEKDRALIQVLKNCYFRLFFSICENFSWYMLLLNHFKRQINWSSKREVRLLLQQNHAGNFWWAVPSLIFRSSHLKWEEHELWAPCSVLSWSFESNSSSPVIGGFGWLRRSNAKEALLLWDLSAGILALIERHKVFPVCLKAYYWDSLGAAAETSGSWIYRFPENSLYALWPLSILDWLSKAVFSLIRHLPPLSN